MKKGQLLAQLENVQSLADVNATRASVQAAQTDAVAADAALNTSLADLNRAKSDAVHAKLDWDRAQGLYNAALIAKQDYDVKKAAWESADAGLAQAEAKVAQAKAQKDSADKHITQNQANLTRFTDVLQKTTYEAPFDGVITNLPVREGETVVIGIQNSPGSTLMTIADMSVITSEVKVDETDIVNVHLGPACGRDHRRHPAQGLPRRRQRNRGQRHRALDRRRYLAGHLDQRGSQGFQGRRDAHRSARQTCAQASPRPPRSRPRPAAASSAFRFRRSPSAPRQTSCPRMRGKGKIIMCRPPRALPWTHRSRRKKYRACS